MTDKVQKIREEVVRLQKRAEHNFDISLTENERQFWLGESNVLTLMGKYIDTMQEEHVSEELEEAASRYAKEEYNHKIPATLPDRCRGCYAPLMYAFKAGANWRNEQMMAKTKSGVGNNDNYIQMDDGTWIDLDPSMQLKPAFNVKEGEKVKVLIFKED